MYYYIFINGEPEIRTNSIVDARGYILRYIKSHFKSSVWSRQNAYITSDSYGTTLVEEVRYDNRIGWECKKTNSKEWKEIITDNYEFGMIVGEYPYRKPKKIIVKRI